MAEASILAAGAIQMAKIKGRLLLPLIQQIHNAERRFIDCMDWVSSHILP